MKIKRTAALLLALVMLFAFTACKGGDKPNKPSKSGSLYAGFEEIFEDGGLKAYYLKNPDTFTAAAVEEMGMTKEDAQAFLSDSDSWNFYNLNIAISNGTEKNYTFVSFEGSETPEGMWFSTSPINGELSIPPSVLDQLYPATVLINTEKISTTGMYSAVANMTIKVNYFETPADDNEEVPQSAYKQLKVDNKIVAPEDDKVEPEEQISAKRTTIEDASAFLEAFKSNAIAFSNESKLYGMDSETAAKAISEDGGWQCYTLNIEINNKTDDELTVNKIIAADNGKNGVWVCSVSQYGEYGMPANDTQVLPVTVLIDANALGGNSAQDAISKVALQLEYIAGATIDDLGNESVLPSKTVDVK